MRDSLLSAATAACLLCVAVAPAPATEVAALQSLYNAALHADCPAKNQRCWPRRTNWGDAAVDGCAWQGVTCTGNSITGLDLNDNNLRGFIPNNVFTQLPSLERLRLDDNGGLTGTFPQQLNQMPNLKELRVGDGLTGPFPDWVAGGHQDTYEWLHIEGDFDNPIPVFDQLTNLRILHIDDTLATDQIPPFDAFTVLTSMTFQDNNLLTGTIPPLDALTLTETFRFWNNRRLSGTIPVLAPLTQGERVTVAYNDVSGTIPKSVGNLTSLKYFDFSHNCGSDNGCDNCDLSGTLPPLAPQNQQTLEEFRIFHNAIEGLPHLLAPSGSSPTSEAPPYNNLRVFHFYQNLVTGTFPCHRTAYPRLEDLRGHENRMSGVLGCLDDFGSVRHFQMNDNYFTGTIPSVWAPGGDAKSLEYFNIDNNRMTGTIPQTWIDKLTAIQFLGIGANQLTGTFPQLRGKSELETLHFHRNFAYNQLIPIATLADTGTPPDLSAMLDGDPNTVYTCDPVCRFTLDFGKEVCVESFEFMDGPDLRPGWAPTPADAPTNAAHTRPSKGCPRNVRTFQSSKALPAADVDDEMLERWYCSDGWNWGTCYPGTWKTMGRERRTNNPWGNWDPWCRVRTRFYEVEIRNCQDPPCRIAEFRVYGGDKRSSGAGDDGITDRMSGTIPDLANAPKLNTLWAYGNDLTGTLPLVQGQNTWDNGQFLVDDNRLEGQLPDFCPDVFENQRDVFIDYNWFTGTLPDLYCLTRIQRLRVGDNMLSGTVPNCTCNAMTEFLADNNACCKLFREEALRTRDDVDQGFSCPRCDCAVAGQVQCVWPGDCETPYNTYAQCPLLPWTFPPTPGQERPDGCLWEYPGGGLEGRLPDYGTMPRLERFGFDNNKMRGPMGARNVSTLVRLQWYRIRNNILAGTLPWDQMITAAEDHQTCDAVRWYLGNNTMWGTVPTQQLSLSRGDRCGVSQTGGWCWNDGRRWCDLDISDNYFWGPLPGGLERIKDDIWTRRNCWDCPLTPQGSYPGVEAPFPYINATWEVPLGARCYGQPRDQCTDANNGWWAPNCNEPPAERYTYDGPTCPPEPPNALYERVNDCRPDMILNRTVTEDDVRNGFFMQVSFEKPEVGSKKAGWGLRFFAPNLFHPPCPAVGPADEWGPNPVGGAKLNALQQQQIRNSMVSKTNQADGWNKYLPVQPANIQVGEAPGNDRWVPLATELDITTTPAPTFDIAVSETVDVEIPDDILLSPFTSDPMGQAVQFTIVPSPGTVNPIQIQPFLDITELDIRDGDIRQEHRRVNITATFDIGETFVNGSCDTCVIYNSSGATLSAPRTCDWLCAAGQTGLAGPQINVETCSGRFMSISLRMPAYDIADGAEETVSVCIGAACTASGLMPCSNCVIFRIRAVTEPPPTITPTIFRTPTATPSVTLRPFCHFFARFDDLETTFCVEQDEFVWWPWLLFLVVACLPLLCIRCRPPAPPPLADLVDLPAVADLEETMVGVQKPAAEPPVAVPRTPPREIVTLRTRVAPPAPPVPLTVTATVVPETPGVEVTARPVVPSVTVTARPVEDDVSVHVMHPDPPPVMVRATARKGSAPPVSPPHRRHLPQPASPPMLGGSPSMPGVVADDSVAL
eukprot:TRINITY_DN3513_c4_g1_i1.p1 TRINITY_DN3513_c4_g1~~TRINITY_DN3513_c4_g1_i1.p1  ORF type:complete len:1616 (+),score=188.30 TRINITY_DN3513_c4_g1_i1:215-5062(+)